MARIDERPFRLTYPDEPGRSVRGVVVLPASAVKPVPFVLIVHGFMGFMDWGFFPLLAERLVARGLAAIRFDLSGSGVGDDSVDFSAPEALERDTPSRSLEDIARVRAFCEREVPELDARRVGLVGHSRGGALALLHAAERPDTLAVVTWNSLASFARWDEATVRAWRRDRFLSIANGRTKQVFRLSTALLDDLAFHGARLDPVARCLGLAVPTLLVCGEADETVAPNASTELADSLADARLERIAGAGHTFGARHPFGEPEPELERALQRTEEFLSTRLETTSGQGAWESPRT
ncbi:MAG: alpha/beta fold hydrolase [Planctomycetes bacterium]|nr:alpha/beta fold hydrolase [Planctomycetota bacterium]